ncbi:MAG: hypothetical protein ABI859_05305 [Pseudomonadota bacterium]
MKIYGPDNKEMILVTAIERQGNELVLKGKIFGTMPMTAKIRPAELRQALRLMKPATLLFALSLLFRRKGK